MLGKEATSATVEQGLMANRGMLVVTVFVALVVAPIIGYYLSLAFGQAAGIGVTTLLILGVITRFVTKIPLRKKGIVNQVVEVGAVNRLPADTKSDKKTIGQLYARSTLLRKFDILAYMRHKSNRSILLAGIAGSGKTTLLGHLILITAAQVKVCFSFKENDDYLRIGYPVLDISQALPDPFADVDAFVTAFQISNPIASMGIQASYNSTMLRKMAAIATTWNEFIDGVDKAEDDARKKRNGNEVASLSWIREKATQLVGPAHINGIAEIISENPNIVLDFSKISNETARTFYSELVLRQIWSGKARLGAPRSNVLIAFDEAHRLIRKLKQEQEFKSILETLLREGRSAGLQVFASTQNYSDIDPKAGNNFGTQFVFQTTNQEDLSALATIDQMLSWAVSSLPSMQFVDAKQPNIHGNITTYQLAYPEKLNKETQYVKVPTSEIVTEEPKLSVNVPEYRRVVTEMLTKKPVYVHETARALSKQYGLGIEDAKQLASRILRDVKKEEGSEIDSMPFDLRNREKEDGEGKVKAYLMYYMSDPHKNGNLSQLHIWQQNWTAVEYKRAGYAIIDEAKPDDFNKRRPDLVVEKDGKQVSVEIETGLKNGNVQDLKDRVEQSTKEGRETIILVPNNDLRQIYAQIFPASIITCFFPFIRFLQKEQPAQTATVAEVAGGSGVRGREGGGNG